MAITFVFRIVSQNTNYPFAFNPTTHPIQDYPMTYTQFLNLDEAEQLEALLDGEFLAQRMLDQHKICLYWLNGLFVEVYYAVQDNFKRSFVPLTTQDRSVALLAYKTLN